MRILLVSPNTLTVPYPVYPLGLDYVAASVAPKHQVRIVDLNVVTDEEFDEILNEHEPTLSASPVAISIIPRPVIRSFLSGSTVSLFKD